MTLYFARKPRILLLLLLLVTSTALFYTITYRDTRKMGSAAPLRLAILEADTPQPQTRDRYGGYTGVFTALLNAAANSLKPPQKLDEIVTIKGYDVVNDLHSYPALEDIDAILITGSRHTAFDNDPWILKLVEYTKKAIETDRVRVVGICFGHQIIGRATGAKLGRSDKGWEVAVTEVDLTDKGKEIFGLDKMVSTNPFSCATVTLTSCDTAHPPDAPRHRLRIPPQLDPPRLQLHLRGPSLLLSRPIHQRAGSPRVHRRDHLRGSLQPTHGRDL